MYFNRELKALAIEDTIIPAKTSMTMEDSSRFTRFIVIKIEIKPVIRAII